MSAEASTIVKEITARLASLADADRAVPMRAYMRDRFEFFGVDSTTRKEVQREVFPHVPLDVDPFTLARELWQVPQREAQYAACEFLRQRIRRRRLLDLDPPKCLSTLEHLVTTKSWWDTVDSLAPNTGYQLLSRYDGMHVASTARIWIRSTNVWLQRSAILLQLKAGVETDVELLFELILHRADSKEFFVRKGAGWALREYSKVNPSDVRAFLDKNQHRLSPLTIREGGKYC